MSSTTSADSLWSTRRLSAMASRRAEAVRPRPGLLGEAGVGRDHHQVGEALGGDRVAQDRLGVQVVDGDA
jgi:hypothetical protein